MRISDWSSDVCSSDLPVRIRACRQIALRHRAISFLPERCDGLAQYSAVVSEKLCRPLGGIAFCDEDRLGDAVFAPFEGSHGFFLGATRQHLYDSGRPPLQFRVRSEEHTSELQSLMRTSYAV